MIGLLWIGPVVRRRYLEMNVYKPLMIHNIAHSIAIMNLRSAPEAVTMSSRRPNDAITIVPMAINAAIPTGVNGKSKR